MNIQSTAATNLQGPDLSKSPDQSNPNQYFNNFYSDDFSVGDRNDAVIAYFETYTGNEVAGKNLAAAVLYTARAQNIDPMTIIGEFQKLPRGQINNYLAALLNINRVPTSSIAVRGTTRTNNYVTRTILP